MRYYIIFDQDGKFRFLSTSPTLLITNINEDEEGNIQEITIEDLPAGAISISEEDRSTFLAALNSQLKNIVLINNEIQVVDKYTPEELADKQAAETKQQELNNANYLLIQSIKFESGVYQRKMTLNQKEEFVMWQDSLLDFINGEINLLPITPEFINLLLGV